MEGGGEMKILLIGQKGQVGWELNRTLSVLGEVAAFDFPEIDLAQPEQITALVREIKPNLLINAAAYTAVDKAEDEPGKVLAINAQAPGILAREAKKIGAVLVHYSTDYVYSGQKNLPYMEQDKTGPLSVYGKSKLEGDQNIQNEKVPHLIFRTSWIYGGRGKNFLLTMLRLAKEKEGIRVVSDQVGSPTWCRTLAEATALILAQGIKDLPNFLKEKGGLYHLTSKGETNWFQFCRAILENDPEKKNHKVKKIISISTKDYPTPAKRPAYSVLSCQLIEKMFGLRLPHWEESLNLVLQKE